MLPLISLVPSSAPPTPERIRKAAGEFEALMIEQMLKAARDNTSTSLDGENSPDANETMLDLANQQLAQLISKAGGLGLTRLIEKGLETQKSPEPRTVSSSPSPDPGPSVSLKDRFSLSRSYGQTE